MRMSRAVLPALVAALVWIALAAPADGQRLAVDRGLRVADLWCFPLVDAPEHWVYLPSSVRLATEDGLPKFSFVRYAVPGEAAADDPSTLQRAEGGGVLHLLVLYDTPEEQVDAAQQALQERLEDDQIELRGPVIFDEGRYSLVSSVLQGDGHELLATGRAPVLEGNRLALSFDLDPRQSQLLMASLDTATPDVSLAFEMTFSGLAEAYDARLMVDWSKVAEHMSAKAGGSIYFVGAEAQAQIDELLRTSAVKLESRGSDEAMEALLSHVYDRLMELLFEPLEPMAVPDESKGGLMDALGSLLGGGGLLGSGNTTGFGLHVGYRYLNLRSEGTSVLDFNHAAAVQRRHHLVFNVGDVYQRYGDDPRFFRAVNLADQVFRRRVVHVGVDGALLPELDRLINSVTVTLRKQHQDGEETVRELVLNRASFDADPASLTMSYGWSGDSDALAWLSYDYRAHWSFTGGGEYRTDWRRSQAAMINLFAPYQRRTVALVDAGEPLADLGVRAVVLEVEYPFFGTPRRERTVVRLDREQPEPEIEITLPNDQFDYAYTLTWMLKGGGSVRAEGRDSSGLVFLDAPPTLDSEIQPGGPDR